MCQFIKRHIKSIHGYHGEQKQNVLQGINVVSRGRLAEEFHVISAGDLSTLEMSTGQ